MTNFEKIVQGGAEALADLFTSSLRVKITKGVCQNKTHCDEEADCRECFVKYLNAPAEPTKPKLTEDEEMYARWAYEEFRHKWIARDIDGDLYVYEEKPEKEDIWWDNTSDETKTTQVNTDKYPFSFVKWEDAEATYLPDLLGDCE